MTELSFQPGRANLPAGSVDYACAGEGPPLFYLHPAAGFRVTPPVERLARRFRVIAPVVPGFDGTPLLNGIATVAGIADVYAGLIDALAGGRAAVVGQSLGAWVGAWLAIRHAAKVEALILASPAGLRPPSMPPLSFEPAVMARQLYSHPERRPPETKTPEQLAANRKALAHYGIGTAWDAELDRRLGEIGCLTLVVHGTKDVRVPAEAVRKMRREIPHAHLVYVHDAAHAIETDQPERVGALYEDFLARGEAFVVNAGRAPEVL